LIPEPDFLAPQVELYRLWTEGGEAGRESAERIHRAILPAIVFMSRSVPAMLCYGKRLFARQAGIEITRDRAPALTPTQFGHSETMRPEVEISAAGACATGEEPPAAIPTTADADKAFGLRPGRPAGRL
jgi:4-hydroxy-tetrahydrodipicolinate synthase